MSVRGRLLLALVSTGLICYFAVGSLLGRALGDSTYSQLGIFNEVLSLVINAYVEPVNLDRTMRGAELGLTEALDGDSSYLDDATARIVRKPEREEGDVGLIVTRRFGFLMVVSPRKGSPADKAGIRTGDLLKTIDGRHTRTLASVMGDRMLHGAPGSVVKLAILRQSNEPIEFDLTRERLQPVLPHGEMLADGTGLLRIAEFPEGTADAARGEIESLRHSGAQRLVLDIRQAAYGSPTEAIAVANFFIHDGVLTRLASRHGGEKAFDADPALQLWDNPVVALIDTGTAGPGEILAAALAGAQRASLVGTRTFGRAGVTRLFPLQDGALLLTVSKYLTPKGDSIHGEGVAPTVVVRNANQDTGQSSKGDPVLDKGIEILTHPPAKADSEAS